MSKLPNLAHEAAALTRSAQQELAQLRKAMKAAEDSIAGLSRAIKDPSLKTRRQTIKKSTSGPSFLVSLGASLAGGFIGGEAASAIDPNANTNIKISGSFYQSSAQKAAQLSAASLLGQRIS